MSSSRRERCCCRDSSTPTCMHPSGLSSGQGSICRSSSGSWSTRSLSRPVVPIRPGPPSCGAISSRVCWRTARRLRCTTPPSTSQRRRCWRRRASSSANGRWSDGWPWIIPTRRPSGTGITTRLRESTPAGSRSTGSGASVRLSSTRSSRRASSLRVPTSSSRRWASWRPRPGVAVQTHCSESDWEHTHVLERYRHQRHHGARWLRPAARPHRAGPLRAGERRRPGHHAQPRVGRSALPGVQLVLRQRRVPRTSRARRRGAGRSRNRHRRRGRRRDAFPVPCRRDVVAHARRRGRPGGRGCESRGARLPDRHGHGLLDGDAWRRRSPRPSDGPVGAGTGLRCVRGRCRRCGRPPDLAAAGVARPRRPRHDVREDRASRHRSRHLRCVGRRSAPECAAPRHTSDPGSAIRSDQHHRQDHAPGRSRPPCGSSSW
jgi:hypothetical protein